MMVMIYWVVMMMVTMRCFKSSNIILVNPFLRMRSERSMYNYNTRSYATNSGRSRTFSSRCFVRLNANC